MSRTPIREILRRLERDRLVDVYPNKGVFVRRQSPKDIQDLFQLRIALEPVAASLAARNRPDNELAELQERFSVQTKLVADDAKGLVLLGESLHDSIVRWTGNTLLIEVYQLLRQQTKLVRSMLQKRVDLESQSFQEHVSVLGAIHAKDARAADALMREHLQRANRDIAEWLSSGDAWYGQNEKAE